MWCQKLSRFIPKVSNSSISGAEMCVLKRVSLFGEEERDNVEEAISQCPGENPRMSSWSFSHLELTSISGDLILDGPKYRCEHTQDPLRTHLRYNHLDHIRRWDICGLILNDTNSSWATLKDHQLSWRALTRYSIIMKHLSSIYWFIYFIIELYIVNWFTQHLLPSPLSLKHTDTYTTHWQQTCLT